MTPLRDYNSYDAARRSCEWRLPTRYNIAHDCCDAWAARFPDRPALFFANAAGDPEALTYRALARLVNRAANMFVALGVTASDRVAVHLGQRLETIVTHLALYKMGAIAVPLAAVFGPDAIAYRIGHAGARLAVTTAEGRERMPNGQAVVTVGGGGTDGWDTLMAQASDRFVAAPTGPDTPAMMIFTSGTTGQPKGALHGHRVLLGHLPGVQMHHDLLPQDGDRLWTPADWAWAGGLLNVLLPSLSMGVPVVAQRAARFDPEEALDWAAHAGVRNAFIPPTALRMMRGLKPKISLRSVGSGGESLGAATFEWAKSALGLTINEFYGQTECNLVLSSCDTWGIAAPGIIGRAVPGHDVAIVDDDGVPVPDGEQGNIAVRGGDPVMMLGYWNDPAATREKYRGGYMLTGDQGVAEPDGVRFVGRDDDVISSAGYRIGPGEIEDCLIGHPAVALAAVVGAPDPVRGEVVAAFVKLRDGASGSDALAEDVAAHVRERLSAHEYPRIVRFVDDIPLTSTGKVIRRGFRQALS